MITIDAELEEVVRLGGFGLEGVEVRAEDPAVRGAIDATAERLIGLHGGKTPSQIEEVGVARRVYRALGLDPTRTRPSSEALLRRVLKGKGLYVVNSLVDAINQASLELMLPFGLYDADRIEGEVVLRRGREGEAYEGIRRGEIGVEGRPVLVDAAGAFGNPTADSLRTSIRLETTAALVVVFAPGDWSAARLTEAVESIEGQVAGFSGGRSSGVWTTG